MCGVTTGSSSCQDYQERKMITPMAEPSTVSVFILFSPYSYEYLKANTIWFAAPDESHYNYSYERLISVVKWTKNGKIEAAPTEVKKENVPASQKPDFTIPKCDKFIMVDCSSSLEVPVNPEDEENTEKKRVKAVNLNWFTATGFLSFAISEVKDYLFRIHKDGANGTVKFTVAGYHPLDPLVMAFCDLVGLPIDNYWFDFSGVINRIKKVPWFSHLEEWLKKYSWTPALEDCAIFEGSEYGGHERTEYSIAMDRVKKIERAKRKMEPYIDFGMYGEISCSDDKMIEWKDNGGATTDEKYKGTGFRPVYHFDNSRYGWDHDGVGLETTEVWGRDEQPLVFLTYSMYDVKILNGARWKLCRTSNNDPTTYIPLDLVRNIPEEKMKELVKDLEDGKDDIDDDDKKINEGIGDFYTYKQLEKEEQELLDLAKKDPMGPKWWISAAPDPSKNAKIGTPSPLTNQIDGGDWAKMMAEEKKKELAAMDEKNSAKLDEYDEKVFIIDQRENRDSREYEIWERRHVEDEDVSDEWNYDETTIEYHGKLVNRQYFVDRADAMLQQRNELLSQIEKLEDYASLVTALKFLSAIQFALGFVSFGATSIPAALTLLAIDTCLELTKMGFELYYNDDYTLGQAIEQHMFSFINNLVSGFLLHSSFAKFTKPEVDKINQFKPIENHLATPGEYIGKQMGDFRMWLDNISYATFSKESAAVNALTKDASLFEKVQLRTEGLFYHGIPHWNKFHLAASGAQATTFLYMANSMYENSLFVTNKQDIPINEMIKLELVNRSE